MCAILDEARGTDKAGGEQWRTTTSDEAVRVQERERTKDDRGKSVPPYQALEGEIVEGEMAKRQIEGGGR